VPRNAPSNVLPERFKDKKKKANEQADADGAVDALESESFSTTCQIVTTAICMLVFLVVPGVLVGYFDPNATVADLSIPGWAILISIWVLLVPACRLLYVLVFFVARLIVHGMPTIHAKVLYYGLHMEFGTASFFWMCLALLAFHLVGVYNPFPPYHRSEHSSSRLTDKLWWLETLFICGIITTLVSIPRSYIVARLGLRVSWGFWEGVGGRAAWERAGKR
jgi:hypothetical protein